MDTLKNITTYMHGYQQYIKSLKDQNICIIGYARKPNGSEKEEVRVNLLHQMCNRLKPRSLLDRVFVSYSCKANDCIHEHMLQLVNIQKKKKKKKKKKVCLVAIDHADLSTNTEDLRDFVRANPSLCKIIIDTLPFTNRVVIYESEKLLANSQTFKNFDSIGSSI
ncbi:hypothetical protein BDF21DRAFT_475693 [Thamnidium elegans]|nr:hypothetical protein BDF21DRAFT_475693 [Thamnidium elegans]